MSTPRAAAGSAAHHTHLDYLMHLDKWQPYCDLCGSIGVAQEHEADAAAIAERHAEVGGFEMASPVITDQARLTPR